MIITVLNHRGDLFRCASLKCVSDISMFKYGKRSIKGNRVTSVHTRVGGEGMNKTDLVKEIARVVSTKKEAQAAVDCGFDTMTKALENRDQMTLVGFGTFKVSSRRARTGRNPKTGEEIVIAAGNVPKFLGGKALKDAVGATSDQ
jgi:nucleoid DNA-binding protein